MMYISRYIVFEYSKLWLKNCKKIETEIQIQIQTVRGEFCLHYVLDALSNYIVIIQWLNHTGLFSTNSAHNCYVILSCPR